jgi:mannonate dehydratase
MRAGISHLRKIAALAELYQVRTGCHGATDLSPVCMGRGAAFRHGGAELRHPGAHAAYAETDAVFPHAYSYKNGYMLPGDAPGHGVEIDEKLAAKYPYDPPICRSHALKTGR